MEAAFHVDPLTGTLAGMKVTLSQEGKPCPLEMDADSYKGMRDMSKALRDGMTPIVSYWSSDDMLWLDGQGDDGQGACAIDDASACADTIKFYDFAVGPIDGGASAPPFSPGPAVASEDARPAEPEVKACASCPGDFHMPGYGPVSLVPTGWHDADCGEPVEVLASGELSPHMGSRAYFADTCTAAGLARKGPEHPPKVA